MASTDWFCKSLIPTTYYLVREQSNLKNRTHIKSGEDIDSFINTMNSSVYRNSCLIIHDLSEHSKQVFSYAKKSSLKQFGNNGIVVKDLKLRSNASGVRNWCSCDVIKNGVYHGMCTFNNAMHIATWMGYKKILFVGVDLYNSRYFWLKKNQTRYSVKQKNKTYGSRHTTSEWVLNLLRQTKKYHNIKMYTYNHKSLLKKVIKKWKKI